MQITYIAQSLHRFHRYDKIGCALCDKVGVDFVGREAQIRLHISATLAHAVNLGLLEVDAPTCGGIAYDGGNGQDALASHTCQYNIFLHYSCALF